MADNDDDGHRRLPLEPHENATVRDIIDAFFRGRWFRSLLMKMVAYTTAILILVGLFRDWISSVLDALTGGQS